MFVLRNSVKLWRTKLIQVRNDSSEAITTALHDFHIAKGGKMVSFGGVRLPLQYQDQGVVASHIHTRTNASLFDVSHMLQTEISGKSCIRFMESLCTADIKGLPQGKSALTVFTNEKAGILDDLIVTKIDENHLYIVSNAGRKEHDMNHMLTAQKKFSGDITIRFFDTTERSLLALQGPKSAEVLKKLVDRPQLVEDLPFMASTVSTVAGIESCRITRCGYTGEDGFEISFPAFKSNDLADAILSVNNGDTVKLAGLAARDSLRLEAGLCLYGNDIDETTTPAEAGLMWLISKRRKEAYDYPGADTLNEQIKLGLKRKRVGLISEADTPPARSGTPIFLESDQKNSVGVVTSGCPSPTVGKNIAMGYLPPNLTKINTELLFKIRNKYYKAIVTKMPFVKTNYYVKPK